MIPALLGALALVATITPAAAAPGDPGEPIKLNPELATRKIDVYKQVVTADGSMVVFGARTDSGHGIWVAPTDGGPAVELVGQPAEFQVSSASHRIVYSLRDFGDDTRNAWSLPIAGGTAVKLNDPLGEGDNIDDFVITPDGSTVVMIGDPAIGAGSTERVRSVPIAGGTPVALDVGDVGVNRIWAVSPTGAHAAFGQYWGAFAVAPVDGSAGIEVDVPGREFHWLSEFTPDGSSIVFVATDTSTTTRESLWVAPVDGGAPVQLSMTPDHRVRIKDFAITPDGSTVIYRGDDGATDNVTEIRSVPIGGGTPTTLNPTLPAGSDVRSFMLSPDGTTVVYRADQNVDRTQELWSVPVGGGTAVRLNGDLPDNGDVRPVYDISADNTTVVYRADQRTNNVSELFSVPIGGGTPTRISGDLVTDGDVFAWRISPDSNTVVYRAEQDTDRIQELYAVAIGGGATTKLAGPDIELGDVKGWIEITADSQHVIFTGDLVTDTQIELWTVDLP